MEQHTRVEETIIFLKKKKKKKKERKKKERNKTKQNKNIQVRKPSFTHSLSL